MQEHSVPQDGQPLQDGRELGDLLARATAAPSPPDTTAVDFLRGFDPTGRHNLVAIDPLEVQPVEGRTFEPGDWTGMSKWIAERNGRKNLYFSVNEPCPDAPPGKLKKHHIARLRAVYTDTDPRDGQPLDRERERLMRLVKDTVAGPIPPTFAIDSGGGVQMFWQFPEKLEPSVHAFAAECQGRGLAMYVAGDRVQNIERIMRLPGTMNVPNADKAAKGRMARRSSMIHADGPPSTLEKLAAVVRPVEGDAQDNDKRIREVQAEIKADESELPCSYEDVPEELRARFEAACRRHPELDRLWNGEAPRNDTSGSGFRAKFVVLLFRAGGFSPCDYSKLVWIWDYAVQAHHDREVKLTPRTLARDWVNMGERHDPARYFEEIGVDTSPDQAAAAAEATAGQLPDVMSGPVPSKFQLLTFDEVADMALTASAKPLVEGLLDQGAMSVLYGDSNVGKTFVMMDLAYHVASGRPWGGRQTEQCSVVYFVTEGSRGAGKRAAALRMKYGQCADFHFVLTPINLREEKADLKPIIEMLRKVDRLGLAVIDTLSRALAGGDESSSVDMGALVQNFDAIRAAVSCHLTVVHHTGKNLARGARGHSLLRAATDTEIEVSAGKITVTKQRDLEKCAEATFGLETVVVGRNERGREVTSCTLRFIEPNETKAGELTPREADVMRAIRSVIAAGGNPANGAKLSAIAAELNESGPEGANRIRDPIKNLVDKNYLVKVRQGFWVPRDIQIAGFFQPIDGPEEAPKNLGKIRSTESPQNSKPQPTVFEPPVGVFG